MKKLLLLVLVFCALTTAKAQDKILREKCYVSYYSYQIQAPKYVVYKLYKGGGKVSRKGMTFKSPLPHFAYAHSGYDIGHMCNAEDFAYNKELEESTFRYYNALPQTPNLNRGIWKSLETQVRKDSQTDSLLIICGGEQFSGLVPTFCFKVVYSLTTGRILYSKLFTNKQSGNTENDVKLNFNFNELRKTNTEYTH